MNKSSLKSMLLVTSLYAEGLSTFKLIPVTKECPYNEGIFNNEHNVLALIGKDKKDTHFMVDKLNDSGEPELNKSRDGYKKHRVTLEKYYEYYLIQEDEITEFINLFAINADEFDYKKYFKKPEAAIEPEPEVKAAA